MAVVTGAGRGIGRASAVSLAKAGFDLTLGDVGSAKQVDGLGYLLATPADLAETVRLCEMSGSSVFPQECDVRDPLEIQSLVDLAVRSGATPTSLTVAVAVAGVIGSNGLAWELTPEELQRDLSVNLHGVTNLARSAVPHLMQTAQGLGRFIAVVSSAGEVGLPRLGGYVASKHAALGFIRSLAADLGPMGVTANAVMPGSTRTELLEYTSRVYSLSGMEDFASSQRIERILEPEEIASAVVWLSSPGASAVTGSAICVDGGFRG